MIEVKILSIESLHAKTKVDKKNIAKAQRFARTLIDAETGKVTRQINADGKTWKAVSEKDWYRSVDETRDALVTKLKSELLAEVKPTPKAKSEKKK